MKRAMSLWFPMLPIEAWRRQQSGSARERGEVSAAVLLVRAEGPRRLVSACCERALGAGVRIGMSVADARSGFPAGGVVEVEDDPARTASALLALGRWAHRFSPRVALDPPDGLLLDITGCARALGGEVMIRRSALERLRRFGVRGSCAIGPSFAGARAVARYGGVGSDDAGAIVEDLITLRRVIEVLPIEAIEAEARVIAGLREVGMERIGQVLALPRSALAARFGAGLPLTLDRMLGIAMEAIVPLRPEEPIRAAMVFDGPTDRLDSIEAVVQRLLGELSVTLEQHGVGVLRLVVTLRRSDRPPATLAFVLSRATRDAAHLWSLIRPRLERTHLGFGVEGVELDASLCGAIEQTQGRAWMGDERSTGDEESFARLLDALSGRLGRERVLRAVLVESHWPERAFAHREVVEGRKPTASTTGSATTPSKPGTARPSVLFPDPELAEVIALTPDGPAHRIAWRSDWVGIHACLGPERIGPEWWRVTRRRARTRDYFALQREDGLWLWAFRELESGRWFVHGVWG